MACLRSACVLFGLLALASGCREQPEGVVLQIEGVDEAEQFWLTIGAAEKALPNGSLRFSPVAPESAIYPKDTFKSGDEVFLDRADLLSEARIAIVLDELVKASDGSSGGSSPMTLLRSAYLIEPQTGVLNDVALEPAAIGAGQWVCAGSPKTESRPSFAVAQSELDCDRDGWNVGADPDDANPLLTGDVTWDVSNGFCTIKLNGALRPLIERLPCTTNCPEKPETVQQFQGCFDGQPKTRCRTNARRGRIPVRQLLRSSPVNPNWELVRLGPEGFSIVFAPSFEAPDAWSVEYTLIEKTSGFFVLNDRAPGGASTTVILDYEAGAPALSCATEL